MRSSSRTINKDVDYKELDLKLFKRLMVFLKPYKVALFFSLLLAVGLSAFGPIRPYLSKVAVDDYIAKDNWSGLLIITFIIFLTIVINGALRFALTYIMQKVGQKVLLDIRLMLYKLSQKFSTKFYDVNPVGRLVTRVTNDVEALNELFSSGVVMIVADLMLIIWIIGFMFYTNVELTLLTLSILPVLFLVTSVFRKKVRELFRELRGETAKMNSFLNEFISGILTIKLFNKEKEEVKKFDEINHRTKMLNLQTIIYYATFFPVMELIAISAIVIVLWYTADKILTGEMTVGILIAFIQYAEMFFRPVRDLTEKYTTLQSAMAASERIFGMLDTNMFVEDRKGSKELVEFKDKIEFKDLTFAYEENKNALKNVSFTVNKGETVAIVGSTGSGKTTIINLLCRFYEYEKGNILIDGIDIRDIKQESLRRKTALVMQDVFLFSRTISENITLDDETMPRERIYEAAEALGAKEFIERLPKQFDEPVTERGSTLSSGQKQLISFCRAFASDPEILILDEATSNIDSSTEHLIENSIRKLLQGRTAIIIAHRLSTIKRADKIIVLHHGEVREIGNHNELMKNDGIYAKLYKLQFSEAA